MHNVKVRRDSDNSEVGGAEILDNEGILGFTGPDGAAEVR